MPARSEEESSADLAAAACECAVRLAEGGDLEGAARELRRVLDLGDTPSRAEAAFGLGVVRQERGDAAGACAAFRQAIGTADPEYATRAAYHLAISHEREGEHVEARAVWQAVVDSRDDRYLPAALFHLAAIADESGEDPDARELWERTVATQDPTYAPLAACALGAWLVEHGDAAAAEEALGAAVSADDPATAAHAWVNIGIARLDQAAEAFGEALVRDDPETAPLAVELLARTLPLRGRYDEASRVWEHGLGHPDQEVATEVRARLRRGLGAEGAPDELWWQAPVEAAVRTGTLPRLAGELFAAIDVMRALAVAPGDAREALRRVARVPDGYAWGRELPEPTHTDPSSPEGGPR